MTEGNWTMDTLTPVEWDVLRAVAAGPIDLEGLYPRFQLGHRTRLADLADALRHLADAGLIAPEPGPAPPDDPSVVWKARFAPTPRGEEAMGEAKGTSADVRPSLFGIWKDEGIDLSLEDLAEVRREMWRNFPRELPE